MNIFEIPRNQWWKYMKPIMQNVNLNNISMLLDNCAFENEEFAYLVLDVFLKKLSKTELESSLIYYKYGYWVDLSKLCDQWLILIVGSEICIDMICGEVEVLEDKDE